MADSFNFKRLQESRKSFERFSEYDFSIFSAEAVGVATKRVRQVNDFLTRFTGALIQDLHPRIQRIHYELVQLNERL